MERRVLLCVPGILEFPDEAENWNFRTVTWVDQHRPEWRARNFDYFCGPIGRAFGQNKRALHLANLFSEYRNSGFKISIACHSNGGDVTLDCLKLMDWPQVEEIHFFSGACERDFRKNGLNQALLDGKVSWVKNYCGGRDIWLRLVADFAPARFIGYGDLGYKGPIGVVPSLLESKRVENFVEDDFGHSSWWSKNNFSQTMEDILPRNP